MTEPSGHRSVRYPFDGSDVTAIDIELPAGSVEVVQPAVTYSGGRGIRNDSGVTITQRGNSDLDAARLDATIVDIVDGTLIVHTPGMEDPDVPPLDIRITVPETANGTIRSRSANITVSRLHDVTAETSSGEISVDHADGDVRLRGGTGELTALDLEGGLDVESVGRVHAQFVKGSSRIVTDGVAHLSYPSQQSGYEVTSRKSDAIVGPRRATATEDQPAHLADSGSETRDPEKTLRLDYDALLQPHAVVKTFELDGPVLLDANLDTRRIRVTGNRTETEHPDYTVRLVPGGVSAEAVAALGHLVVEPVRSEGGITQLLVHGPAGSDAVTRLHTVEIDGPAGLDFNCVAPEAVVRTGGTVGAVDVATGGSVHLKNVSRDAKIVAGGDVSVQTVSGDLGISSKGAVTVDSVAGTTLVMAARGATVKKVTGTKEYDVSSTSGDVRVGTTYAEPAADGTLSLTGTGPAPVAPGSRVPSGQLLARAVGGPSSRDSTVLSKEYGHEDERMGPTYEARHIESKHASRKR